ncbi:hypothetical protein HanRHA438_Chr08g0366681 [Helianthus annuus]|uniref:Uncharacterized protein n=1 Tax=Helianthus annuus TaxID=4232 RepID=A0A251U9T2_HELAN|nr:hypothetical protein HanXRQr2_Chr08g0354601 [Helianthus annuus]KAJ0539959.1 hypothetical protein HanHA300_Chr08g0292691 [Helianthus annuus]KAJ0548330.1 hypothetical protein HanIR_Chr08g0382541 [Helianthus annuus]KAJ0554699.1 hypothetical protein HanHA89_Chr08g0311171 [Helianthus annuus]KAJ0720263.1 hypothetical protein HanLR1_Chr08g0291481 [Helianthus annuus]
MACKKSVKIPNFLPFPSIIASLPSNTPASFFIPKKTLSHALSLQLQLKRLAFRRFPSPPLLYNTYTY